MDITGFLKNKRHKRSSFQEMLGVCLQKLAELDEAMEASANDLGHPKGW